MDNEPTLPALLTRPSRLVAEADAEPGHPFYKLIFVIALLVFLALAYFT